EVVYRADSIFPIRRLGLKLRQALAEDAGTVRGHFADCGQFPSLADPSAWAVGLASHHLCHRRAFIFGYCRGFLDHFRCHFNLLMARLLLDGLGVRRSYEQMLLRRHSRRALAPASRMPAASGEPAN